ncbi:magnesium transporter MRS2-E isoform X2 [Aegilops tauschii subsp. strangulata]|uniref:magnesium transporter MRS2-E isoform X2 n=1 Tax=Aegilops tauschii subsp. strangulata TaxID=200361 RepID=UPI001E1CACF1|nr:magnesium transporter MRS2-E isoform X5 [Aegilops tauschii subsp. strangulata]
MERRQPQTAPAPRRKGAPAASQEWLVVPAAGEESTGEFGRHRIMEITGLPARDLRMLDPQLSYPSTILGRDRAVVVNLEHVKAIVTAAEVLVRDPGNPRLRPFLQELHARLALPDASTTNPATDDMELGGDQGNVPMPGSAKIQPFEFKVLEVCLEHTCKCMESEVRDDIEQLVDDDTDMSEMYLTRKLAFQRVDESSVKLDSNKHASPDHEDEKEEEDSGDDIESSHASSAFVKPDVEELEMLLEAYFVQFDGTLNKLCHLRDYVDDTEDYINMMLDEKQNQLLQMGVMLTTATVVITAGIVVVSLFGMNIHIELTLDPETPEMARIKNRKFWETTWATVAGCAAIYILAIYAGKKSKYLQ